MDFPSPDGEESLDAVRVWVPAARSWVSRGTDPAPGSGTVQ